MSKGPKAEDFTAHPDKIESRKFKVVDEYIEHPSSVVIEFDCPFCHIAVKAYLWSLSGGGKRCKCGAFFSRHGVARHWRKEPHNE